MLNRVFVCPKCRATCLFEDWNEQKGKCKYCTKNKYHAQPVIIDTIRFDSQAERRRYDELKLMERDGQIYNLRIHTKYDLVVNGIEITTYTDDFNYQWCSTKELVVEDVKGESTKKLRSFQTAKRLMLAVHGIEITVVEM